MFDAVTMRTCSGSQILDHGHDQICFLGRTCPLCEAMRTARRTNDELMELRKQIIELEKKSV